MTLTACSENNGNSSEVNESAQITESPQSTSTAQITPIPEEISEPEIREFPVVIYPNMTVKPDDETVILDMAVIGEAEEWGYEQDRVEDFSITLKRTAGGFKIDGFGGALNKDSLPAGHYDFYPLTMSFLKYNNVFLELDNLTEFTLNSRAEEADKPNRYYRPLNETEEIIKLLEDNAKPGEAPAESSALYLDSLEYPDENTILLTVSSRDVHEDGVWIKAAATFTRTPDGLQLKACDPAILNFFAYYSEIRIEGQ